MGKIAIPGRCRVCGCTDTNPCIEDPFQEDGHTCAWLDFDHTLCDSIKCIGAVSLQELEELTLLRRVA